MDIIHEQQRKKLWCEVYVAYVRSDNSTESSGGASWADRALREFDKRFPATVEASDQAQASPVSSVTS